MIDHQANIDVLTRALDFWERKEGVADVNPTSHETVLGLQFRPGDLVIDSVTGKGGEVLGGTRTIVTLPNADSPRPESGPG